MENIQGNSEKLPKHIFKDGAKWMMVVSKIVLDSLSLWPERQNYLTRVLNFLNVLSYCFFIYGNCYYLSRKDVDLGSFAYSLSLMIISFEASVRIILAQFYAKRLKTILSKIYYEFWASDLIGNEFHQEITQKSRYLFVYNVGYTSLGVLCVFQYVFLPYFTRNLPLRTAYPFPWQESPYYELLYIWQSFIVMAAPFHVGGLDLFFVSLVYNCVVQFIMLRKYLEVNFERAVKGEGVAAKEVVNFCIRRHNSLIEVCKEIDGVFTYFILMQYLTNILTICLSSFSMLVVPGEVATGFTYLTAHMGEIFTYCYMGNDLSLESMELSDAAFRCGWHLANSDQDLQKSLIMLMIRSQKPIQISTGGFGFLSLASFMKLIQFAFSVYTLLNALLKKQGIA